MWDVVASFAFFWLAASLGFVVGVVFCCVARVGCREDNDGPGDGSR
jgi:hypothetical protein